MRKLILVLIIISINSCTKRSAIVIDDNVDIFVDTETVSETNYKPTLECFGNISYTRKTTMTAPTDGYIQRIYKEVGDRVRRGERILKIQNTQILIQKKQVESSLESAITAMNLSKTMYDEAKRNVEAKFLTLEKTEIMLEQKEQELELLLTTLAKKEELFLIDGLSEEEIESLRFQVYSKELNLKSLKVDLKISQIGFRDQDIVEKYGKVPEDSEERKKLLIALNTQREEAEVKVSKAKVESTKSELESINTLISELTITSPYSGVLGSRSIEEGERVKKSDDLVTTFTNDKVHGIFSVQENQVNHLTLGQIVLVQIPSLGKKEHEFVIEQISPIVDQQSGNVAVKAISDNHSNKFLPGMFFKGKVNIGHSEKRIFIDESTLFVTSEGISSVFILNKNRVYKRNVEIEQYKNGKVWVKSGLSSGDKVVLSPPPLLVDGMEVKL